MVKFDISTDVLPIAADLLFAERDTAAFRALLMKTLRLGKMEFISCIRDDNTGAYTVKLVTQPELGSWVPKTLRKYLEGPSGIEYTDTLTYIPAQLRAPPYHLRCTTTPSFFSEKVDIHSTLSIIAEGPGACRQVLQGEVSVKLVGLGRLVENVIVESLKQTYSVLPQVVERWCSVREEILQHPNGLDLLRRGAPVHFPPPNSHAAQSDTTLCPTSPTVAMDMQPAPPQQPGSPTQLVGYKAKRPAALQVQGLETYHSLRSLQQPFADTPLTASFSAKRKRPGLGEEPAKLLDLGGDLSLSRVSTRSNSALHPSPPAPASPTSATSAMDTDGGTLEEHGMGRARSGSLDGAGVGSAGARRSRSGVSRRGGQAFRQQSLQLGDLVSSRDAHSEAGTDYYDPAGDFVYCTCGECVECLQDVQTAAAILGDRQRALTELEGTEECAALPLPQSEASSAPRAEAGVVRDAAAAAKRGAAVAVDASQHALGVLRRHMHRQGGGWTQLGESTAAQGGSIDPLDAALFPPLEPTAGTVARPARGAGHRRGSSLQAVYSAAAATLQPGQWATFNDNFAEWHKVWDDLEVAEAPLPNSAARLLHLLALLHSWNLLKFVDPATGKTIRPAPSAPLLADGHARGEAQVEAAAPKGKVRVRGRWLFRCFNCYVQEDDLLLVEAERLNSKISKKERAEETSKQRLLLGTTTKRPH